MDDVADVREMIGDLGESVRIIGRSISAIVSCVVTGRVYDEAGNYTTSRALRVMFPVASLPGTDPAKAGEVIEYGRVKIRVSDVATARDVLLLTCVQELAV